MTLKNNNGPVLAGAKINKSLLPIAAWSLLNAWGPHRFCKINAPATNWSFTTLTPKSHRPGRKTGGATGEGLGGGATSSETGAGVKGAGGGSSGDSPRNGTFSLAPLAKRKPEINNRSVLKQDRDKIFIGLMGGGRKQVTSSSG